MSGEKHPKGAAKRSGGRKSNARRDELRKSIGPRQNPLVAAFQGRSVGPAMALAAAMTIVTGAVMLWAVRAGATGAVGRTLDRTFVVRAAFEVEDAAATARMREQAEGRAPRVYTADNAVFDAMQSSLVGLPTALADAETLDAVAAEIREAFSLDEVRLNAVRRQATDGEAGAVWVSNVQSLLNAMRERPILDSEEYQLEQTTPNQVIRLLHADGTSSRRDKGRALNVGAQGIEETLRRFVGDARFGGAGAAMVAEWLGRELRPTYRFDAAATDQARTDASEAVPPSLQAYSPGDVLAARGMQLTEQARSLIRLERDRWLAARSFWAALAEGLGVFVLAGLAAAAVAVHIRRFDENALRKPARMAALAGLLGAGAAVAVAGPVLVPGAAALWRTGAVVFVGMHAAIAYGHGAALICGAAVALWAVAGGGSHATALAAPLGGLFAAVLLLKEIRNRQGLLRAGLLSGVVAMGASLAASGAARPWVATAGGEAALDAVLSAAAPLCCALVTLGVLPTIERVFGVVTAMTLVELRDPRQPLLRELQLRAPGTYNHSLTVATLAENAAEAIGADGLHVYVGALYHDVGKMLKPGYFVENQTPEERGRHAKLNPAISLLVIVGHVKDGVEIAREYGLPRSLRRYIQTHHGTTLVRYFYHQAQQKALKEAGQEAQTGPAGDKAEGPAAPDESSYRYPGPKPSTREEAVLMLCDAAESATRALSDPTPRRIEGVVHDLAMERLFDGQFAACALTLGDLSAAEAAISKTLSSVYHGRIAYPAAEEAKGEQTEETAGKKPPGDEAAEQQRAAGATGRAPSRAQAEPTRHGEFRGPQPQP